MGQLFSELSEAHIKFIAAQKIFFIGTAVEDGHVHVSPKGMDSFKVLYGSRVAWLNVTGSGNETSAHTQRNPRMTIMFCSFDAEPLILRIYGAAKVIHRADPEWTDLLPLFKPLPGARQIFDVAVELVQTSCGMAVPFLKYVGERESLNNWAIKKGEEGLERYWREKNRLSIDEIPTNIAEKSGLDAGKTGPA